MGSENRDVRDKQLVAALAKFDARTALLKERGLEEKVAAKDPVLKNLKAGLKKARGRIKSIETTAAHVKTMSDKDTKIKKDKGKGKGKGKGGAKKAPKAKKK